MESKIISDSCVDFNEEVLKSNNNNQDGEIDRVPFRINIDDEEIIDKDLDTDSLIAKMKASKNKILTACPSPNDFFNAYQKCAANFIVTISSKLSGAYNSAITAIDMIKEAQGNENSDESVYVFDSESAAAGESLVALKVKQLIEEKLPFAQIVEKTNLYIANLKTFFVLESLDNLIKNGRISHMKGFIGSVLNIVPIMGDNGHGEIELKSQVRGKKKAMEKLVDMIGLDNVDFENTILGITHVNAKEKAHVLKEAIQERYPFKDIIIFQSSGLSTVYADDGGIVIAY